MKDTAEFEKGVLFGLVYALSVKIKNNQFLQAKNQALDFFRLKSEVGQNHLQMVAASGRWKWFWRKYPFFAASNLLQVVELQVAKIYRKWRSCKLFCCKWVKFGGPYKLGRYKGIRCKCMQYIICLDLEKSESLIAEIIIFVIQVYNH